MDLIIKESDVNGNYSHKELVDEVTSMMTGVIQLSHTLLLAQTHLNIKQGHDTTALAFTWFLYTIAKHPEHQVYCVIHSIKNF